MKRTEKELPAFGNPDIWGELKMQCYLSKLDYRDYPAAEYKYFDKLSNFYKEYRAGHIPLGDAEAEEQKLYREYKLTKDNEARALSVYKQYQRDIIKAGSLRAELNKAQSRDDKLRIALEIIGILTGEREITERNMKNEG